MLTQSENCGHLFFLSLSLSPSLWCVHTRTILLNIMAHVHYFGGGGGLYIVPARKGWMDARLSVLLLVCRISAPVVSPPFYRGTLLLVRIEINTLERETSVTCMFYICPLCCCAHHLQARFKLRLPHLIQTPSDVVVMYLGGLIERCTASSI